MKRPELLTAKDLLFTEVLTLHRASSPEGIHGYALGDIFTDEQIRSGSIYRRLGVLADRGLLTGRLEDERLAGTHTGPARRIFSITDEGRVLLGEALSLLGIEAPDTESAVSPVITDGEQAILQQALPVIQRLAGFENPGVE